MELERESVSDVVVLLSDTLRAAQRRLHDLDIERRRGLYFEMERESLMEAHNLEKRELRAEIMQLRTQLKEKIEASARHATLQAQLQETQEQNQQLRQQVQELTRNLEHMMKQKVRVKELQNELVLSKMAQRKDQDRITTLETQMEALLNTNTKLNGALKRSLLELERVRGDQTEEMTQLERFDHLKLHSLLMLRYELWTGLLGAIQDETIKRHALGLDILEYKERTKQFFLFVCRLVKGEKEEEEGEMDIASRRFSSYAFWLELSACVLELLFETECTSRLRTLYANLWRLNSRLFIGGGSDNNGTISAIIQQGPHLLRCLFDYFDLDIDLLLEYSPGQSVEVELSLLRAFLHKDSHSESRLKLNPCELIKRIRACPAFQFFITTCLGTTESNVSEELFLPPDGISEQMEQKEPSEASAATTLQSEAIHAVLDFQPMAMNALLTLQEREEQNHAKVTALSRTNEEYQHELGILSELLRHTTDQLVILVETNRQLQLVLTRYDIDVHPSCS
ncbi:hypothetical protein GMRT_12324 [Giardia muris]|uniref:Uncharacterized protein n=1 Tax=Giardia muris TaxID=5742 RepID=A0A4Z1SR46_GIAMU|nr:hypothetical protein GMRT_12324 [Giardia muris]|eukprot:TNJ28364.1 hypothetical protein GMRT_12324 [Giardia muris]